MRIETDVTKEQRIEHVQVVANMEPKFALQKNFDVSGARVEVGLNAFSFNDELIDFFKGLGGMSVFDLIDYCAHCGIKALDLTAYYFVGYPVVPPDEYLFEVKRYARKRNVVLCGTGVRNDFADPDPVKRNGYITMIKNWIEATSKMGIDVIRVFSGVPPKDYKEEDRGRIIEQIVACLKECAAHASKHGVLLGLQHHADMLRTADETIEMVKLIDSPWVGVILDTGNFISPDPYEEIDKIMPYVINWQLKESVYGHNFSLKIDLERIMKIVRKHGYRGYLPIEILKEGDRRDVHALVPEFINAVQEAINNEFEPAIKHNLTNEENTNHPIHANGRGVYCPVGKS